MTEAELDQAVRRLISLYGLWGYHTHDSRRSQAGWPDWVIIGKRILFRELKSAIGGLTADQRTVGYRLQAAGADWAVWRPLDFVTGQIARELEAIRLSSGR